MAFPFAQFISPLAPNSMIERSLNAADDDGNSSSGPYKKLKNQSPNGVIISSPNPDEENDEVENMDRQGLNCHLENGPVNLINRNKNSRQNTESNDFYPGHGLTDSQPFPMTFMSGFMTASVIPAPPNESNNTSSPFEQLNLQHDGLQNQQIPMMSLSDISAMKTDWFRMKYTESQDPMWAYLLEQQEDFLKFTNKITEIINICSLPTEENRDSEDFGRNRTQTSSRRRRNARNNEEESQNNKRKVNKKSKKQLRNKRSS